MLLINTLCYAQADSAVLKEYSDSVEINKGRVYVAAGIHLSSYTATLLILSKTWYEDEERTGFHTFNDAKEWLQVDKVGHGWTAYNLAKYSSDVWRWTGIPAKKAVILGGISSIGYQTVLEFLDAYSAKWGWSWADMGANLFGAGLYTGQQLLWNDQRIDYKFSSHRNNYPDDLEPRANELFGSTLPERLLKDYNYQTYWLSFNLKSLVKNTNLPSWLSISVGYGAEGLYGGFDNIAVNESGDIMFDRRDIKRKRQWYLSPDIDLTKLKTKNQVVKSLFSVFNMIKVPAPTLEFSNGKFHYHWLHF